MSVDGPYQITCDGGIGGTFVWNDCGLELTFPPKCSRQKIEITMSALLPLRNEVHPGFYIVSAVFKFHCNVKKFDKPFTLCLQHCINLQSSEDCCNMCFVIQHGVTTDIEYGHFGVGDSCGSIKLNKFCCISIAWIAGFFRRANLQMIFPPELELPDHDDQNKPKNPLHIIDNQPNRNNSKATTNSNHESTNDQQYDSSLSANAVNTNSEMVKEQGEIKQAVYPSHKYEEMVALPKNHSKLAKWIGIYSVYVKKAAWRTVSSALRALLQYTYTYRIYVRNISTYTYVYICSLYMYICAYIMYLCTYVHYVCIYRETLSLSMAVLTSRDHYEKLWLPEFSHF